MRRAGRSRPDRGRPDLLRPLRQPGPARDPGLPPRPELRRSVRPNGETTDYARVHRCAGLDARAVGGCGTAGSCSTTTHSCRRSSSATCRSALSVAKSADDPDDPESVLGIETKPFYTKSTTRTRTGSRRRLRVRLLLRRSPASTGAGEALARPGHAQVPHQRRGACKVRRRRSGPVASASNRPPSTTARCAEW